MDPGLIGGGIGGLIGLAGGVFGTWCSIRNTKNPRERSFTIRAATITWIAVLILIGSMFAIPRPYCHLLWIPYGILLPLGIIKMNRAQQRLRKEGANDQP